MGKHSNKIAVGSTVVVVETVSYLDMDLGMTGTVLIDDRSDVPYYVYLENGNKYWLTKEQVELVKHGCLQLKLF